MKTDTSGIDTGALAREIRARYAIPIESLTFVPKGEDAFSFVGTGENGNEVFVRAQPDAESGKLDLAYRFVDALRSGCDLPEIVAPQPTLHRELAFQSGAFVISVFPRIAGTSAYERAIDERHLAHIARVIARMHDCRCVVMDAPRIVTFTNPFEAEIREAFILAKTLPDDATGLQLQTAELVSRETQDVLDGMRRMHDTVAPVAAKDMAFVPTHGDPNLANIMIDGDDGIHIIDWGDVGLGPRERDLFFFVGDDFERFLRRYLSHTGPINLHLPLFTWYDYLWVFQEIADYACPILRGTLQDEEEQHAWEELQPYLPIRHDAIARNAVAVKQVIRQLASEGLVRETDWD